MLIGLNLGKKPRVSFVCDACKQSSTIDDHASKESLLCCKIPSASFNQVSRDHIVELPYHTWIEFSGGGDVTTSRMEEAHF